MGKEERRGAHRSCNNTEFPKRILRSNDVFLSGQSIGKLCGSFCRFCIWGISDLHSMIRLAEGPSLPKSFGSLLSFDMSMALFTSDLAAAVHMAALLGRLMNFSAFFEARFEIWKEADDKSASRRVAAVQSCVAAWPFWKPSNADSSSAGGNQGQFRWGPPPKLCECIDYYDPFREFEFVVKVKPFDCDPLMCPCGREISFRFTCCAPEKKKSLLCLCFKL